jgi:FkbM family methyltransferase
MKNEFIGATNDPTYGGWELDISNLTKDSIVYSFGVGDDVTWDSGIIERFGCDIYAFDMTPATIEWIQKKNMPDQFHFHPYGLSNFDGNATFYLRKKPAWELEQASMHIYPKAKPTNLPVKRLSTIMSELGHTRIDVLKIDIEGEEYNVLSDIGGIPISQILVEFHTKSKRLKLKSLLARFRLWLRGYKKIAVRDTDYTFILR